MTGCLALGCAWTYPVLRKDRDTGRMRWVQICERCHDERPAHAFIPRDGAEFEEEARIITEERRTCAERQLLRAIAEDLVQSYRQQTLDLADVAADRSPVRPDYPA